MWTCGHVGLRQEIVTFKSESYHPVTFQYWYIYFNNIGVTYQYEVLQFPLYVLVHSENGGIGVPNDEISWFPQMTPKTGPLPLFAL